MRRMAQLAMAAVLVASACGQTTESPAALEEPATPATDPTETPATTSTSTQPVMDVAVLRADGLGSVDFGTPAEDAIEELSALLGQPDLVESLAPVEDGSDGCVAGWLPCLRYRRVVVEGQLAVWVADGLEVAMVDTRQEAWPKERTSLLFGDWHATVASGDVRLVTEEGLYPGMTVRELRELVPWVDFHYHEGTLDSFYVTLDERGDYWGLLDWNPDTDDIEVWDVAAVQEALNEKGAGLAVDGAWGPRSETAWLTLLTELGIEQPSLAAKWPVWLTAEIGEALGFPPDDITVGSLTPRAASEAAGSDDAVEPRPTVLRRGDRGDWVVRLQAHLIRHGYSIEADGIFGPATEAAVLDFQTAHSLDVDGLVGPATWNALLHDEVVPVVEVVEPPPTTTTQVKVPATVEYVTYGAPGVFRVIGGDPTRLLAQPVVWAADDGAGGIVFTPQGSTARLYLPAGHDQPVQPAPDLEVPDPRTGGDLVVSVEGTDSIVPHARLVFHTRAGDPVEVPHNPQPDFCSGYCTLDAMLSPDGEILLLAGRVLEPEDLGVTTWDEYEALDPSERQERHVGAVHNSTIWVRAISLSTGDEIWSMGRPEGFVEDFDGRYLAYTVSLPGNISKFPWSTSLTDIFTGTDVPITWATDDVELRGTDMCIDLVPSR